MKRHHPAVILFLLTVYLCCFRVTAADVHQWSTPAFVWTSDESAATAYQTCTDCEQTRSDDAFIAVTGIEATCMKEGSLVKTAYAEFDGASYTDSRTAVLAKVEHSYTSPDFSWNPTDFSCQASWSCTVGGESETKDCDVTKETLPPDGTCYTASVTVDGILYTDTLTVPGLADSHAYISPEIRWSDDLLTAEAVAVCTLCDPDAPARILSAACTVTVRTTPASCTEDGEAVYTARAILLDTVTEDSKTVVLPRLSHQYTVPQFHWNGILCDASYTCTVCGKTALEACDVSESLSHTSCTEPGTARCTAVITVNGITYSDQRQVTVPAKGHTAERITGTDATCTLDGCTDGMICTDCGAVLLEQTVLPSTGHTPAILNGILPTCTDPGLSDGTVCVGCGTVLESQTPLPAAGHTPITIDPVTPTCTESGSTNGVYCSVCKTVLTEPTVLPAMGHCFGQAKFFWSHDGETVYAVRTCSGTCGAVLRGEVLLTRTVQEGQDTVTVTASAVFPDGTTAQESKVFGPNVPSEEPSISPDTPSESLPIFADVPNNSYYSSAVAWAAQTGITQGTSKNTFSPDMICTRAQVVTMLWRAAGFAAADNTIGFTDVPTSSYYYRAVVWASAVGITAGTSKTEFSPDLLCSRAQIVTMLWRAAGCPTAETTASFSDVASDAWYADAVTWAVSEGITLGTGDGTFSPDAACTRAQIVTFLYRAQNNN